MTEFAPTAPRGGAPGPSRRRVITIIALAAGLAVAPGVPRRRARAATAYRWSGRALGAETEIILHHADRAAAQRLIALCRDEIERLEHALARDLPPGDHERLLVEYAAAREAFELESGYALEHRARAVLFGLGFREADLARDTGKFSGGWQSRIALARLLLSEPEVLLLDEPTNHLDLDAATWLESYLSDYPGAVVAVSHDRWFLDRLVHEIVYLWNAELSFYKGNFTEFQVAREAEEETLAEHHAEQTKKIEKTQKWINRFRASATKAKQVQSRIRQLEKLERIEIPPPPPVVHFRFPSPPQSAKVVLAMSEITHDYGAGPVFAPFSADLLSGAKIGLVGPNGSGKTTLLRVMAGSLPASPGRIREGSRVEKATFWQDQAARLSGSHTILAELQSVAKGVMLTRTRELLGVFLFTGDDVEKPVSVLSGGEKSRISLAKILCENANLLLLDEPTNHLDLSTRQSLEEALQHFPGTVVVVSHDRYFMDRIVEEIWEVKDGRVRRFLGNYSDYLYALQVEAARAESPAESEPEGDRKDSRKKRRQVGAAIRQKYAAERARRQGASERAEARVVELERERDEIDAQLADPAVYNEGDRSRALVARRREIDTHLETAYADWEGAHEALEALENMLAEELDRQALPLAHRAKRTSGVAESGFSL